MLKCPIIRLLILHLNLPELCCEGQSLDEGASLEEIYEQVLFYYHDDGYVDSAAAIQQPTSIYENNTHDIEEAVQFAGLCSALYGLPSALGDPDLEQDRTKEVFLGNSTLIFIQLEAPHIIAVAQVSRLYPRDGTSTGGGGGGNPLAIRSAIQLCHQLFTLLRGGGITFRLSSNKGRENIFSNQLTESNNNDNNEDKQQSEGTSPYPGMKNLFEIRRKLRKLRDKKKKKRTMATTKTPQSNDEDKVDTEIKDLEESLATTLQYLPITSIRFDLNSHFTDYLSELTVVVGEVGNSGHCLVENIPVPIPMPLKPDPHVVECAKSASSPSLSVSLGLAIRECIRCMNYENTGNLHLLGLSTFYKGQLLYSHHNDEYAVTVSSCPLDLSVDIACSLMGYMASYRNKMHHSNSVMHGNFSPLASSIGIGSSDSFDEDSRKSSESTMTPSGSFLSPPPSSMLSSAGKTNTFRGENGSNIWAPFVWIPTVPPCNIGFLNGHIVMYEFSDFSFLIYIKCDSSNENFHFGVESTHCTFFRMLSKALMDALNSVIDFDEQDIPSSVADYSMSNTSLSVEPGQDIIFVDRYNNRLALHVDQTRNSRQMNKRVPTLSTGSWRRKLRNVGHHVRKSTSGSSSSKLSVVTRQVQSELDWAALGLDCRHRLTSLLPLDTILAFDDVINEVHNFRQKKQASKRLFSSSCNDVSNGSSDMFEICNSTQEGWVYAYSDGDQDLFIFFDGTLFVTVADVQNAAFRARKHLLRIIM